MPGSRSVDAVLAQQSAQACGRRRSGGIPPGDRSHPRLPARACGHCGTACSSVRPLRYRSSRYFTLPSNSPITPKRGHQKSTSIRPSRSQNSCCSSGAGSPASAIDTRLSDSTGEPLRASANATTSRARRTPRCPGSGSSATRSSCRAPRASAASATMTPSANRLVRATSMTVRASVVASSPSSTTVSGGMSRQCRTNLSSERPPLVRHAMTCTSSGGSPSSGRFHAIAAVRCESTSRRSRTSVTARARVMWCSRGD